VSGFAWVYSEKVKEHFMDPRNVLEDEAGFGADGRGLTGNVKCGDEMLVVIKVDEQTGTITDCKWRTFGCASAIASTSVLSEMVKGMRLEDAYALSARDVQKELGGLPEHKVHCSVLGDKALRQAINDYLLRAGMPERVGEEGERIVCQCVSVTPGSRDQDGRGAMYDGVVRRRLSPACARRPHALRNRSTRGCRAATSCAIPGLLR